jgi:hypothetical protein
MNNFYCHKTQSYELISQAERIKRREYCRISGITGLERDKLLSPHLFRCETQCFDCMAIVGERRLKTKEL